MTFDVWLRRHPLFALGILAIVLVLWALLMGGSGKDIGLIIIGVLMFAAYFLPALVAEQRQHRQRTAIKVLNLLLGWTLIGWVLALVWAFTSDVDPTPGLPIIRGDDA